LKTAISLLAHIHILIETHFFKDVERCVYGDGYSEALNLLGIFMSVKAISEISHTLKWIHRKKGRIKYRCLMRKRKLKEV